MIVIPGVMKFGRLFFASFCVLFFTACGTDEDAGGFQISTYSYDFSQSDFEWQAGFSDFPSDTTTSGDYHLKSAYTKRPSNDKKSLMISGNNHSDDLFMFLKRKITGLSPNTIYTLTFEVEFASEAKRGQVGAGGAPGESVFFKAGATPVEPHSVVTGEMYSMNIDKGNQSENGKDMVKLGDISVPADSDGFVVTTRSNSPYDVNSSYHQPIYVQSNAQGELWLIVGTDSGYEGNTTLYYTKITTICSKSK